MVKKKIITFWLKKSVPFGAITVINLSIGIDRPLQTVVDPDQGLHCLPYSNILHTSRGSRINYFIFWDKSGK